MPLRVNDLGVISVENERTGMKTSSKWGHMLLGESQKFEKF